MSRMVMSSVAVMDSGPPVEEYRHLHEAPMTPVIRPAVHCGMPAAEELLRTTPIFSRLAPDDRRKIAEVATVRRFERGDLIFEQESPSDALYAIASGRVKIFKMMPNGKDVILEVFGPGVPLGAVAAYMDRPFPASASALEDTTCVIIPRPAFFRLIESQPSLVRGLLLGLTVRLVELTNRLAELTGGRI